MVSDACKDLRLRVLGETEFYLVNLLNQFMTTQMLYTRNADGTLKDEPLAFKLKEALETPETEMQRMLFRHIGDVSLYTAGFFQERLVSNSLDLDYYVGMGGSAYSRVAASVTEVALRDLYSELSDRFQAFVEVLATVSAKTTQTKTEKDLIRVYELWLNTKNERAAKVLQEAGIPLDTPVSKTGSGRGWQ